MSLTDWNDYILITSSSDDSDDDDDNGGDDDDREIIGTRGNDNLTGSNLGDEIYGRQGNDTIRGLGGNDDIEGEQGNDRIDGGNGIDDIEGGSGNDSLIGGVGNDDIEGDAGNDTLIGYGGTRNERDLLEGDDDLSNGRDTFVLANANSVFYNNDRNRGFATIDDVRTGDKIILEGSANNYRLQGDYGRDRDDVAIFTRQNDLIAVLDDSDRLVTSLTSSFFNYI